MSHRRPFSTYAAYAESVRRVERAGGDPWRVAPCRTSWLPPGVHFEAQDMQEIIRPAVWTTQGVRRVYLDEEHAFRSATRHNNALAREMERAGHEHS